MHRVDGQSADVKLSEVIAGLSYSLDLVEGQPPGHVLRSAMIGMTIADKIGLPAEQRSALFYALLLKDLGCSSNAAKMAYLFGANDHTVKHGVKTVDWTRFWDKTRYILKNVAPGRSLACKVGHFCSLAWAGEKAGRELIKIRCERGANIARELEMPEATVRAIHSLDEHWNGCGHPEGLSGDQIPLLARIMSVAQTTEVFAFQYGAEAACDAARARSGRWFDPELVRAFLTLRHVDDFWVRFRSDKLEARVAEFEPPDRIVRANSAMLDRVSHAFGQVIDAKSPWTASHSRGVADVAVGIAEVLGVPAPDRRRLRRAGLLHDIGKLGVSNLILDKPGKLDASEMDILRRHPLYTHQILSRVTCLHDVVEMAASHHERLDGSGYHRGYDASNLNNSMRILAVADMYEALAAKRPYRKDLAEGEVLDILGRQTGSGICPTVFGALKVFLADTGFVPYYIAA